MLLLLVENTSVAQKTPRRHAEVPDSSTDGQTTPSTSSNNVSAAMMKALQLQMANGVESKATEPSQSTNQNISLSDREVYHSYHLVISLIVS